MKIYEYNGKEYTLTQASKEFNVEYSNLRYRLNSGMSFEQAITMQTKDRNKIYKYNNKEYTVKQAAKEFGINEGTLWQRLKFSKSLEEIVKFKNKFIGWEENDGQT